VLATVHLSHSDTSDDLKRLIEGRINALAHVHGLFVQSRWTGAELHSLVTRELLPYCGQTDGRVRIDGPPTHRGFGMRIVENMIADQLRGHVHFDWRNQGLACEIVLPLA
jgi:two-component sensor histidine kinase